MFWLLLGGRRLQDKRSPGKHRENKMTVFGSERDKKQKCQLLHAIKICLRTHRNAITRRHVAMCLTKRSSLLSQVSFWDRLCTTELIVPSSGFRLQKIKTRRRRTLKHLYPVTLVNTSACGACRFTPLVRESLPVYSGRYKLNILSTCIEYLD